MPTRKPDDTDLTTPFYAVAGLADVIAETLRETLAERQQKAEQRFAEIRDRRLERVEQARVNADELREFLSTLPDQFRALPETTRVRLAELQRQAEELIAQAGDTYSSLAGRGKRVVDERVGDVRSAGRTAREGAEEGLDGVAETVEPVVDQAQEAVTEVRRNVTGRAARARTAPASDQPSDAGSDEVTPESATQAARAAAATAGQESAPAEAGDVGPAQALAQDQAAAKKATAKKTTAKKAAPAKPAKPAKKAPAKKAAATKTAAAVPDDRPVADADAPAAEVAGPGTES